mmetsp:Transcript_13613/g.20507  ORF Transcript_13613/g.20507 Transcript_13613/m.20507 type:complete len:106 (+) Transcript_13613:108-425(+)
MSNTEKKGNLMTRKYLDNLITQITSMHRDQDRIRLVNAAYDADWDLDVDQLWELIECQHFGDAKVYTAVKLYSKLVDKDRFNELLVEDLYYPEDIKQIKEKLSLK